MTRTFDVSVEIEADSEEEARTIFDHMREACVPSDYGVVLYDLRPHLKQEK